MSEHLPVLRWTLGAADAASGELSERLQREGALVESTSALAIGSDVTLEVAVADSVEATLVATVRFVDAESGRLGVAVELVGEEERAALAAALRKLRKPAGRTDPLHERIRALGSAERTQLARSGGQAERVLLERIYGKVMWETLLQNPRITHPEVARIARMGAIPMPLVEQIAGNAGWLSSAQVRRALLSNPRLSKPLILKVLKTLPKHELRLMEKQTAYPRQVVALARDLLQRGRS